VSGETVRLSHRAPFAAAELLDFLGTRAVPGIEERDDGSFRRSVRLAHGAAVIELTPRAGHVAARLWLDDPRDADDALERCRRLLDLHAEPSSIDAVLRADPLLRPLVEAVPGRRVPGSVDGGELALRAVLGQQVSLAGARTVAGRLVAELGTPLERPVGAVTHLFPEPAAVAGVDPARLPMPRSRAACLTGLAASLASGELRVEPGGDDVDTERRLLALPGIGPWTVAYVSMRALRDPDAFPASDLGVRRALERLGRDGSLAAAARAAERWRPYRAYGAQHLWGQLG